jgi:hypothetical protein
MERLHEELFTVHLFDGLLFTVVIVTVAVTALLTWRLFAPFSRRIPIDVLVAAGADAQTVAVRALRGRLGRPSASAADAAGPGAMIPSTARQILGPADAWFSYLWETSKAWQALLSSLVLLSAASSALSTFHEIKPSFDIEHSNRNVDIGQALYGVTHVLTARLTKAAAVCAVLALISGAFQFCLRRRRAEWTLVYRLAVSELAPDENRVT